MKRILTLLAGLAASAVLSVTMSAQSGYEVKGVVVDALGPVIGAAVMETGTNNGTVTDIDGNYTLKVSSADAMVEISSIGYVTQTFRAADVPATVTMSEDTELLEEVVVIGYGTVKKSDMTGSVSAVKADQLNKGVATSPTDLLMGKSAGVVVTMGDGAPGSSNTIRIRGGSSLNASNDPLIVIDGLPISETGVSGVSDALASVNPNDIETFTVLKDASATAIYGSRASNGVIMITTKKGSSTSNKIHVSADFTASLSQNAKYVDVLTGDELRSLMTERYGAGSEAVAALGTANTDWQKEIYQLGQTYDFNASVSGGVGTTDKFRMPWRVSVGGHLQTGTLMTSHMNRGTVAVNLSPTFFDRHLTINLNGKGSFFDNRFANTDAVGAAVRYDPTKPVYDDSANGLNGYSWWNNGFGTATIDNANTMAGMNPVALLKDKEDNSNANRFIGNAQIVYKMHGLEALSFNLNLGLDYSYSHGTVDVAPNTEQSFHSTAQSGSGYHTNYNQTRNDQTLEAYLSYDETFKEKHTVGLMAGYSWQHYWNESFNEQYKADGTSPDDASYYLATPTTTRGEYFLVSFFGRANYSFDNRIGLTATVRYDGTSRFSNNKWGLFPSVAASYNFMRDINVPWLSTLKLRLSWGQTGQQDVGSYYPTLATYITNTNASMYYFGNTMITPITPEGYNADLKWETTSTYNAGIDYGFLDGRIYGSIDYYQRYTKDLLNYTPVAAGSNLSNYLNANIGNMESKGTELELNAIPVQTRDWSWTVGFNATWNKTEITKLTTDDEREDYFGVTTGGIAGGTGNTIQVHQTGHTPYSFWVYEQIYDTDGRPIEGAYVDQNNDGIIDNNDKICYHSSAPTWTFGFNTTLAYKQWTLALSAHSNVGNYVYDNISSNGDLMTDLWTNAFVNNRTQSALEDNVNTNAQYFSNMYVKNASFLKLDKITLSRAFNFSGNNETNYGLNVFVTLQNVATITGYKGIDPEIFSGIDNNMYPRPRTYILGVKFNF